MSSTRAPAGRLAARAATPRARLTKLNANKGAAFSHDYNRTKPAFATRQRCNPARGAARRRVCVSAWRRPLWQAIGSLFGRQDAPTALGNVNGIDVSIGVKPVSIF